jgi:hypothetical protein
MALLDHLMKYVRTGTAEGDKSLLGDLFITPSQFDQLCAIEPGGMRILVGNKGIGKSAIVEWIDAVSKKDNLPCLLIRPDNIVVKDFPAALDIGSLKAHYYGILIKTIAARIGSQLKGFLKGDAARLYKEARDQGLAEADFVEKSLELFSAISSPVHKIDGVKLAKDLAGVNSPHSLIGAIKSQLLNGAGIFYLLIDDTDQLAAPDQSAHLNRIWALLLAVRRLVGECPEVRAIVTLRSTVWQRMSSESVGQRDQTDHLRGLVVSLKADDTLMESIIRRRLHLAAKDSQKKAQDPYTIFFSGTNVTLPTSTEVRPWDGFIIKSARERPRDAIQLIKNMIDVAGNTTKPMGADEADKGMKVYSKERVDDVVNEYSLDCKNIRSLINSFVDVEFDVDFETLRAHLHTVPSRSSTVIRGEVIKPETNEGTVKILSLLHECGFINARVVDSRKPKGFDHILFQNDPNFVRWDNWNSLQSARWEIHPAFRTYLIGLKKSLEAATLILPAR